MKETFFVFDISFQAEVVKSSTCSFFDSVCIFSVVCPTSSLGVCFIPDQCQHFTYAVLVPPSFTTFLPRYTEEVHPTHGY